MLKNRFSKAVVVAVVILNVVFTAAVLYRELWILAGITKRLKIDMKLIMTETVRGALLILYYVTKPTIV